MPETILTNIPRLIVSYYTEHPDMEFREQHVSFGTSGHRGSPFKRSFNEDHILAISQSISEYRKIKGINGPLFIGMDTHALSEPALRTSVEVFAANDVEVRLQSDFGYTPTPVVSQAILSWNSSHGRPTADGVVITPSHNPPEDGGFKYNPPHGGPADTDATSWIEDRANELIAAGNVDVRRENSDGRVGAYDFMGEYVRDLGYAAIKLLDDRQPAKTAGNGAIVCIQGGRLRPIPFCDAIGKDGRVAVRMVSIDTESYAVARSYMIRQPDVVVLPFGFTDVEEGRVVLRHERIFGSALRNNWSSEIPSRCSRLHAIRGTAFPWVSP